MGFRGPLTEATATPTTEGQEIALHNLRRRHGGLAVRERWDLGPTAQEHGALVVDVGGLHPGYIVREDGTRIERRAGVPDRRICARCVTCGAKAESLAGRPAVIEHEPGCHPEREPNA